MGARKKNVDGGATKLPSTSHPQAPGRVREYASEVFEVNESIGELWITDDLNAFSSEDKALQYGAGNSEVTVYHIKKQDE